MVLKIPGDDTAAEQEAAMHMGCHDIPGVVGPVELKVFGAGSRVSVRVGKTVHGSLSHFHH